MLQNLLVSACLAWASLLGAQASAPALSFAERPAQGPADEEPAELGNFGVGLQMAYYMASPSTASFYNGEDNDRLQFLLNDAITRQRIRDQAFEGFEFNLVDYARNMRYRNTMAVSLQMDYKLLGPWYFLARFSSVRLEAVGEFTFEVERINRESGNPEPYIERAVAGGRESRSHISLGLGRTFDLGNNFYAGLDAGLDINFVEVLKNNIVINGREFTLPTFTNQRNPQAEALNTVGLGFFLSPSIVYQKVNDYGFSLHLHYMRSSINVNRAVEHTGNNWLPAIGFTRRW